jgi:hypothetical protein
MCDVPAYGRPLAAALLCLLLCGCFVSEGPKFALTSAVPALGEGGRYVYSELDANGAFHREETYQINHRGDGAYDVINKDGGSTPASLHPMANGMLIMQANSEHNQPSYFYYVLRIAGDEALVFVPHCNMQDKDKLASIGVETRAPDTCLIDGVADAAALFATANLGDPIGKIVREQP